MVSASVSDAQERILILVRHYLPGYRSGGPVRTVANLVSALGNEFDLQVICKDRDATDTKRYPSIKAVDWQKVGKANVQYLPSGVLGLLKLLRTLRNSHSRILYVNSFFDPVFAILPLVLIRLGVVRFRRVVLASRGEFSVDALRLKSWKKRCWLAVFRLSRLDKKIVFQATCSSEYSDIQRELPCVTPVLARNIASSQCSKSKPLGQSWTWPPLPLRICFLSRISPMKNLDFAIRVIAALEVPVAFDIYGPIRDNKYWGECKRLISENVGAASIEYRGALDNSLVQSVISGYDLFFLPTRGENFGHVIVEALLAGTPVLISNRTPWTGLEAAGIGWDISLEDESLFRDAIVRYYNCSYEERARYAKAIEEFVLREFSSSEAQCEARRLFKG